MVFRADEAAALNFERARRYLISRELSQTERKRCEEKLLDIVDECGPVVDGYPTWHPLVSNHDDRTPETLPRETSGYLGLDHTRYFAHGFITCPYTDGSEVLKSVNELPSQPYATITAERLDVPFYSTSTNAILVRCEWNKPLETGKTIPKSLAVPLMLEMELPGWRWASYGETWESMRPYLLGEPHGSRSSLFVSQETALAMKNIHLAMINSGMFGPIMVR